MSRSVSKRNWVIEYVNGQQFVGRYSGQWTRSYDLSAALLFDSKSEAENARQALVQEAGDRLSQHATTWPDQIWWDFRGGCLIVSEVETVTRLVRSESKPPPVTADQEPE